MGILNNIQYVYFIGIGGIGMSALARYFNQTGKIVAGYDRTPTALTKELENELIAIHFEDNIDLIDNSFKNPENKEAILVVYTPAVPKDHKELNYFLNNQFQVYKRSEILGLLSQNTTTVAVAGTHGKTTTSTLITHILKTANINLAAFLGGISSNYNSNLIYPSSSNPDILVVEADEYDRSFLQLSPQYSLITAIDPDHLDIYENEANFEKTFAQYANQTKSKGFLVKNKKLNLEPNKDINTLTYGNDVAADYFAKNIRIVQGQYIFDLHTPKNEIYNIKSGLPGWHNVENAVAAFAIADLMQIPHNLIVEAIETFKGVKRRFEYIVKKENIVYIDDYAHHPTEIEALVKSVKALYPHKKITGIFQPHLFSRTKDFAEGFAESLEPLDKIILLNIYPARELPIEGITSAWLLEKIKNPNKILINDDELLNYLQKIDTDVLLTIGAGDIDKMVEPIKRLLDQ